MILIKKMLFVSCLLVLVSCKTDKRPAVKEKSNHFVLLTQEYTGINFKNSLVETAEENHLINENFITGAGVAIGDINNDGLPDIYFSGNQVNDKLYLNNGNLTFTDISKKAGIEADKTWSSGVTFADVNLDGYLDIYVCKNIYSKNKSSENLLFINNGDLTFTESGSKYRVNDRGYSIQANFFDYNKDGFIDMYLINQPPSYGNRKGYKMKEGKINPFFSDKLFKNLGGNKGFVDVSKQQGIQNAAHGLSASVGDINNDNWLDVYVTNDYNKPDYLYVNKEGAFKNKILEAFKHISNFSMGSDIADYDNDGFLDIMVVDMVAEDHKRIKTNMGGMNVTTFNRIVENGWHHQYMFNTLQKNNGNGTFSDLAQLAGVSNTDWSWGPLIADFDNDGLKDIFVTNGIKRNMRYTDVNNKYEKILDSIELEAKKQNKRFQDVLDILSLVKMAPEDKLKNYIFKNNGNLTFENKIEDWGFSLPTLSSGAAYADLDLDGDLDLVINNINQRAFVYRNTTIEKNKGNFIRFNFSKNKDAVFYGSRVKLYKDNKLWQIIEMTNNRGYMSKSEDVAHFGVGDLNTIDKVEIVWADSTIETINNVKANQEIEIVKLNGVKPLVKEDVFKELLFKDITNALKLNYIHKENVYNDYKDEVLLPHKMSQFGPYIAVGDVNNDGLDDFYIGGSAGVSGSLFIQKNDHAFSEVKNGAWVQDIESEDMGATFLDVDGDNDLDLFVVSGGNEFGEKSNKLQDRLYINNGEGEFFKDKKRLPNYLISGSVVEKADFDNDGDLDLFIGGRLTPKKYPDPTSSKILENKKGYFVDVTKKVAKGLNDLGLVTSANWVDINKDNRLDLVIVGEWMPISVFIQNKNGKFSKQKMDGLNNTEGWYYSIKSADFDLDGDMDLVVGNLGLNYKYKASKESPFQVHSFDFDKNGVKDIVLSYYEHGQVYPVRGRSCSLEQMPSLGKKFPTFESFGDSNLNTIYGKDLDKALNLKAYTFASVYIENIDGQSFKQHKLPQLSQVSSINNILIDDFDADENLDILVSGNLYSSEIETPRNDASIGLFLKGDGKNNFKAVPVNKSGFYVPFDSKSMEKIQVGNSHAVIVGNNSAKLQIIKRNR
ncbi:VCBS repeat-containing protein [Postechiella marina]|uniref:VCBS repeat-containing protein n=1 Tax=Postechiella marina TaxID=943941 RepID=A0ABP8CAN1_9FLAO